MKIHAGEQLKQYVLGDEYAESVVAAAYTTVEDGGVVACGASETVPFVIDLVLPEGHDTGDNRSFKVGSVEVAELPIPVLWQEKTGDGHDKSVVVGRIDSIERIDPEEGSDTLSGLGNAHGVLDAVGPYGAEVIRLIRNGFLRGVSADLDKFEGVATVPTEVEGELADGSKTIKNYPLVINQARLRAVTIVAKHSFEECSIRLDEEYTPLTDITYLDDGVYEPDVSEDPELFLSSLVAAAAPVVPPAEWFEDPNLAKPTPLTVTDSGQVYGHIATFASTHIGMAGKIKPPKSKSGYKYFKTGVVRVSTGEDVPVGQITLSGGHADLSLSAGGAKEHYDNTASAMCDVNIGEDRYGIWVAGGLRPGVTPEQVRAFRASAPSGDWRPIGTGRRLELVAVCQVNVPGFPTCRAMVAGGQVQALVAAGTAELLDLRNQELESRVQHLEDIEFGRQKEAALSVIAPLVEQESEALTASAESAKSVLTEFATTNYRVSYDEARRRLVESLDITP